MVPAAGPRIRGAIRAASIPDNRLDPTRHSKPGQRNTLSNPGTSGSKPRGYAGFTHPDRRDAEFSRSSPAISRAAPASQEGDPQLFERPNSAELCCRQARRFVRLGFDKCELGEWPKTLSASEESCPQRRIGRSRRPAYGRHNRRTGFTQTILDRAAYRCDRRELEESCGTPTQRQPAGDGEPDQAVHGSVQGGPRRRRSGARP